VAASNDEYWMREALSLARQGLGRTSPNPAVGAVLVRQGRCLGRGWHRRAGTAHAEIAALQNAQDRGHSVSGADLYVTLEPCSTHGRTPPCVEAILHSGVRRVIVGAIDPNPSHRGAGLRFLARKGIEVQTGILTLPCLELNEAFNHHIARRRPWVVVKAAMTLDGKIATREGDSKWITSAAARADGMRLRWASDALVAGVETVRRDDPELSLRGKGPDWKRRTWRRFILDTHARIPLEARILVPGTPGSTTIVVGETADPRRIARLEKRAQVWVLPEKEGRVDVDRFLQRAGAQQIMQILVEGGGEVQAAFLLPGLAHRVAFYYATAILGGNLSRRAVAGDGATRRSEAVALHRVQWRRLGPDWRMTALTRAGFRAHQAACQRQSN